MRPEARPPFQLAWTGEAGDNARVMGIARRLLSFEDLLWALWLVVLAPASGGLFLEGGPATVFLLVAALGFWVSALLGDAESRGRRRGWHLFLSLGVCTILIDAGLGQVGADIRWRMVNTAAPLGLGLLLAIQHRATGGATWIEVPSLARRALAWPFIMILADNFGALLKIMVDTKSPLSALRGDLAPALFSLGLIMPTLYAFFVVAPRLLAYAEEDADAKVWVTRYLWAALSAWAGASIIAPLSGG